MVAPTSHAIAEAARRLAAGELVAFPTETVYGLGADAANPDAVRQVFLTKGRPADHPLIVHVADAADVEHWAMPVDEPARRLMAHFWPGPLTLILPRRPTVSDAVTGGQDTVGVRCPSHPVAQALLRAARRLGVMGVAAPSANRFGRISPTRAAHVRSEFGQQVPCVLDGGASHVGIESTIVDLSRDTPAILRPGQISAAALSAVLGVPLTGNDSGAMSTEGPATPRVSGSLAAHYAPGTMLQLVPAQELAKRLQQLHAAGQQVALWSPTEPSTPVMHWRQAPTDVDAYARELYATLRELDGLASDVIVLEAPPSAPAWAGVRDRLRRAVAGSGQMPSGEGLGQG